MVKGKTRGDLHSEIRGRQNANLEEKDVYRGGGEMPNVRAAFSPVRQASLTVDEWGGRETHVRCLNGLGEKNFPLPERGIMRFV